MVGVGMIGVAMIEFTMVEFTMVEVAMVEKLRQLQVFALKSASNLSLPWVRLLQMTSNSPQRVRNVWHGSRRCH